MFHSSTPAVVRIEDMYGITGAFKRETNAAAAPGQPPNAHEIKEEWRKN